jgi:hypothetical protein
MCLSSGQESRSPHSLHLRSPPLLQDVRISLPSTILHLMIVHLLQTQVSTIQSILWTRLSWMHSEAGLVNHLRRLLHNSRGRDQALHQRGKRKMRPAERILYRRSENYLTGRHVSTEGSLLTDLSTALATGPRARSFPMCRACKLLRTGKT